MAARQALECPSGGDQRLTDRVLRQMARGGNRAGGGQFTDAVASARALQSLASGHFWSLA